eukprot:NODE_2563_length_1168_cov_33.465594_g2298_i1.p1 GENE.NODE_2563_length_1168_cov_33.465594_g2298_i1~~NODE_2563_length_1168_cov_33.465594_g2298_i1.p1  ORF type:complete len:289 (+),score=50.54 NODE_2563_length_1168_cov_33.465594_g2298_i1:71-937(+)
MTSTANSIPSGCSSKEELEFFMRQLRLDQFLPSLLENGWDNLQILLEATPPDVKVWMKECGLKSGHIAKLQRGLSLLRDQEICDHMPPSPILPLLEGPRLFGGSVSIMHGEEFVVGAGDFSITLWVRATKNGLMKLLEKRTLQPAPQGYTVALLHGSPLLQLANGKRHSGDEYTNYSDEGVKVNDGQWHHLAFLVNRTQPGGLTIYVDGALKVTRTATDRAGSLTNTKRLVIGDRSEGSPAPFVGSLARVRLFQRRISLIEVIQFSQEKMPLSLEEVQAKMLLELEAE